MHAIKSLPEGWIEARRVVLTDDRLLLRLNLLALIPLALTAAAALGWAALISRIAPPAPGPEAPWLLSVGLALLVLPLHELVHGAVILGIGHRPRLGIMLSKGVLYATADDALFTRNQYLAVALAPLVVLSAVGMLLMLLLPSGWWWTLALALILNNSGAVGDLWAVFVVRAYPVTSLVRDTADGFIVYSVTEQTGSST